MQFHCTPVFTHMHAHVWQRAILLKLYSLLIQVNVSQQLGGAWRQDYLLMQCCLLISKS